MTQSQLERRVRFLMAYAFSTTLLVSILLFGAFGPDRSAWLDRLGAHVIEADTVSARVLVTEQIEIFDRGVLRVRLGGQLPDAVIAGRRVPRGGTAAGILLYDATGQERSGYVTFDESGNVLLTLDGRSSQTAYFVADTSGTTTLRLWYEDEAIDLRTDEDGARVSVMRDGMVVLQKPSAADPDTSATCARLRELRAQYDDEQVRSACRTRMTGAWCDACLD